MSETLVRERKLTAEEFYDLYAGSDQRADLNHGEVLEIPPVGPAHGGMEANLGAKLIAFVREHSYGGIFGNCGFVLGPDTVRRPDLAFVSAARMAAFPKPERGFWPVIPDLAVEIISPDDRAEDLAGKVADYTAAGVRLTWVIYRQEVYVHRRSEDVEILRVDGVLDGQDVLPGFRLPLSELWV